MLSGPKLTRLINQFEAEYLPVDDPEDPKYFQHHQSGHAAQKSFHKQVCRLFLTINNMGNPFLDDFPEPVNLDSRNCIDESGVNALRIFESIGKTQYQEFVRCVLEECSISIHDPIKKNSIAIFKQSHHKVISKQGKKVKMLQNNVVLFGQLYISCKAEIAI